MKPTVAEVQMQVVGIMYEKQKEACGMVERPSAPNDNPGRVPMR